MFCPSCGIESVANARFCMSCGAAFPEGVAAGASRHPPVTPAAEASGSAEGHRDKPPFAGFWRRFGAALLDLVFIAALSGLLLNVIEGDALLLVVAVFCLLYFPVLEASPLQGTPGKRLFAIKVVAANGARAGFGRALARNAAKLVSLPLLFPLPFLMSGFTVRRQSLADILAGCLVVRRPVTASDLAAATPGERGRAWWLGLAGSLALGLVLHGWLLFNSDPGFEIRRSLDLVPPDEPLLRGSGERPEQ